MTTVVTMDPPFLTVVHKSVSSVSLVVLLTIVLLVCYSRAGNQFVFLDNKEDNGQSLAIKYVIPRKLTGLLDDSQDFDDNNLFRSSSDDPIRDHHQTYLLNVSGIDYILDLKLERNLIIPKYLDRVSKNNTQRRRIVPYDRNCFYTGTVRGFPQSHAALFLCDNMTGSIRLSNKSLYIKPTRRKPEIRHLHEIEQVTDPSRDYGMEMILNQIKSSKSKIQIENVQKPRKRRKRNISFYYQDYVVELLVVIDQKLVEIHDKNDQLIHFVLTLMSHVQVLLNDVTIGNPVSIAMTDIVVLEDNVFGLPSSNIGVNSEKVMATFCKWQNHKYNNKHNEHHDAAIFLIDNVMCDNKPEKSRCSMLGLASLGEMCNSDRSCALIQNTGLSTAYTIVHEIGHLLGMVHDDTDECRNMENFDTSIATSYFMYPKITGVNQIWSKCSKQSLSDFLNSERSWCLGNNPKRDRLVHKTPDHLPGELFDKNRQCKLHFGTEFEACHYEEMCNQIWCRRSNNTECVTSLDRWADGTHCAPNKWCYNGKCVDNNRNSITPVNGGWGPWGDYDICSRPCDGGIQVSRRICDSPEPTNGGAYCKGYSIRYRSCNVHSCPINIPDFRNEQCAEFDGKTMGLKHVNSSVRWRAKYGMAPGDACKLYCEIMGNKSYHLLRHKVKDGTKCHRHTSDVCVSGTCRSVGCDNVLNSGAKLDFCAICKGDNSKCKLVNDTYIARKETGYIEILRIRKGSTNIDVRQIRLNSTLKDTTYLVIQDASTGEFLLNGNNIVSRYAKDFIFGGISFKYNGALSVDERIHAVTRNRSLSSDLIVGVLLVENPAFVKISYSWYEKRLLHRQFSWRVGEQFCSDVCEYGFSDDIACVDNVTNERVRHDRCENSERHSLTKNCSKSCYTWIYEDWKPCSCNGTQLQNSVCVESVRKRIVQNDKCDLDTRPRPNRRQCDDFDVTWITKNWSSCSATCGYGHRNRRVYCVCKSTNTRVENQKCARNSTRPPPTEICYRDNCMGDVSNDIFLNSRMGADKRSFHWHAGSWQPCSRSCGSGWRTRLVVCRNVFGEQVDYSLCNENEKPDDLTACNNIKCPLWKIGPWSACDKTCNKYRHVVCKNSSGNTVPDNYCSRFAKPMTNLNCFPCANESAIYYWKTAEWAHCSVSCGTGSKQRHVSCWNSVSNVMVQNNKCIHVKKPRHVKQCSMKMCPQTKSNYSYSSKMGSWSQCFLTRRKTLIQKRVSSCYETKTQKKVDLLHCKNEGLRMKFKRRCFRNCQEVQHGKKLRKDDNYFLYLNNTKRLKIYCSNMNTRQPLEYVTLRNSSDNTSEFYDLMSINQSDCSANRNCESEGICVKISNNSRYGKTVFSKIRLNVTSLKVIADDFTFARQVSGFEKIPYGSAGDCFSSSRKCPMGKFQIDLSGTGLRLSEHVSWFSIGNYTSEQVVRLDNENRIVQGRCGGFCGECRPQIAMGLQLEIS